jgi:hypothetical protein
MDIDATLEELRRELENLNQSIAAFERLMEGPRLKSTRRRKSMSHEERLAVSERMKAYWGGRRKNPMG